MNEEQQRKFLYVADQLDELLEILGTAAEIILTELEEAPSDENADQEDEEFEAICDVMVYVERLERDINRICTVEKFPVTKANETYLTSKN